VKRDKQTIGGTKGFSLKPGTLSRHYLTAKHRAADLERLRELIVVQKPCLGHSDLQVSRINRYDSDVSAILDLLENYWANPFCGDPMDVSRNSVGLAAPPDMAKDLLKALEKGEAAYAERLVKLEKGTWVYDPIKKLTLKTFSSLKKGTVIKG
jgi:hypothetical protein